MSSPVRRFRPQPKKLRWPRWRLRRTIGEDQVDIFGVLRARYQGGDRPAQWAVLETILRLKVIEEIEQFICINQPPAALTVLSS